MKNFDYRCRECGHEWSVERTPQKRWNVVIPPNCVQCQAPWIYLDIQTEERNFGGFERKCHVCGLTATVWDGTKRGYCSYEHFNDPQEKRHRGLVLGSPAYIGVDTRPMVADVLSLMRREGISQDEAVIRLGGTP